MIDRSEILALAGELGLQPRVVEKDYVLGWVLAGIAHDVELARAWLFKGGTCLKKCYFETYRFSEDLDFTITTPGHLDRDFLMARFTAIASWLYEQTGIELPVELLRFNVWDLESGGRAGEGRDASLTAGRSRRVAETCRGSSSISPRMSTSFCHRLCARSRIPIRISRPTASPRAVMPSKRCSVKKSGR